MYIVKLIMQTQVQMCDKDICHIYVVFKMLMYVPDQWDNSWHVAKLTQTDQDNLSLCSRFTHDLTTSTYTYL